MKARPLFPAGRAAIVGVLNLTPDSFSDGGLLMREDGSPELPAALCRARALQDAGAAVLDVGGESTRPGAKPVSQQIEIARTLPVVEALVRACAVPVSIDTRRAATADAACRKGACIVNDVSGGRFEPALLQVAARHGAAVVLGHLRSTPEVMQEEVAFEDVLEEVGAELAASVRAAEAAGIPRARIAVDPGIGFGKRLRHNLELLAGLARLRRRTGTACWVGVSRKSFLGELTGAAISERDPASHVAGGIAVFAGADALRVHDVPGAALAVSVAQALRDARAEDDPVRNLYAVRAEHPDAPVPPAPAAKERSGVHGAGAHTRTHPAGRAPGALKRDGS